MIQDGPYLRYPHLHLSPAPASPPPSPPSSSSPPPPPPPPPPPQTTTTIQVTRPVSWPFSGVSQTTVSLVYGEPLTVVLASVIGLKVLAQVHRRVSRGCFAEDRVKLAEAQGLVVAHVTELILMLILYSAAIMLRGSIRGPLQLLAILCSLSAASTHTADACLTADRDTRAIAFYPEYYHLVMPTKAVQAKLGLQMRSVTALTLFVLVIPNQ